MDEKYLFQNQTTNVDGAAISLSPLERFGEFINRTLYLSGTMDGATFSLLANDGTSYIVVTDSSITTSPTVKNISIRSDYIKGRLSGGGVNMSVTVAIV